MTIRPTNVYIRPTNAYIRPTKVYKSDLYSRSDQTKVFLIKVQLTYDITDLQQLKSTGKPRASRSEV